MSATTPPGAGDSGLPPWDDLILLGRITRTQGHRGAVRMLPEFEPLNVFEGLKSDELILRPPPPSAAAAAPRPAGATPPAAPSRPSQALVVHVADYFFHKSFVVLTFAEVPDMNAAERLQNYLVYVRPEHIWDLPEGQYFIHEIFGFEVVDQATGRRLGVIQTMETGAAHDYLVVRRAEGKGEFLIPLVKPLVSTVDKERRRVLVALPEGLEEL